MTGPAHATSDAFARFRSEVDAALTRGRRAAAEASAVSAAFRNDNRELADRVRGRRVTPRRDELTGPALRRAATGFRQDQRLPVDQLPEGEELLADPAKPGAQPGSESGQDTGRQGSSRWQRDDVVSDGRGRRRASGGRQSYPDDDDEDFSQERILS
ncbi:hypothetical protein [Goodfellowiella coeruleoviolacea]|uniref:Uncharacterized protein n=1 Tax=Goodfellowiella coeruleoviolacea TaxID=334858 RepID=A0AAE3GEG6_9PSEU|nr:hypothetical protein [Goodfellowiella coeruleoviolacea]MCP2165809.1 hypothetical protein [Goodfellowiella coeruleoviolacea]